MAGDTHFRSNIRQQGDDSLTIEFNTASFVTSKATTSKVATGNFSTITAITLNATTAAIRAGGTFTLAASSNLRNSDLCASAALGAASTGKLLRITDPAQPATPYFVKVRTK